MNSPEGDGFEAPAMAGPAADEFQADGPLAIYQAAADRFGIRGEINALEVAAEGGD